MACSNLPVIARHISFECARKHMLDHRKWQRVGIFVTLSYQIRDTKQSVDKRRIKCDLVRPNHLEEKMLQMNLKYNL